MLKVTKFFLYKLKRNMSTCDCVIIRVSKKEILFLKKKNF